MGSSIPIGEANRKGRYVIGSQGGPYRRFGSLRLPAAAGLAAAARTRLLRELALGVAGLLGRERAAVRAGLAVELARAGRVERVRHFVLILESAILFMTANENKPGHLVE